MPSAQLRSLTTPVVHVAWLADTDPFRTIVGWAVARNGTAWLDALHAAPTDTGTKHMDFAMDLAKRVLSPIVQYYVDFYDYWYAHAHTLHHNSPCGNQRNKCINRSVHSKNKNKPGLD